MPSFKDITVVAIHGNGGMYNMLPALEKTAAGLPGCKKLLIPNVLIESDLPQKLVHQTMGYIGYSHFVIYCLAQYIETDYVLIVQDDGWMLNADNWRNEWFDYDYIGGLTHAALDGDQLHWGFSWADQPNAKDMLVVQNGGFSLRSRRFLEAPTKYGIVMIHQQMEELNNEDIQLCCLLRPALESVGMKFAPNEESRLFSYEHLYPSVHGDMDLKKIFGHHSRFHKLLNDKDIKVTLTQEEINNLVWEDKSIDLLKGYGYNLCLTPTK